MYLNVFFLFEYFYSVLYVLNSLILKKLYSLVNFHLKSVFTHQATSFEYVLFIDVLFKSFKEHGHNFF